MNYERWLTSHTPLQIKEANLARRRLSKKTGKNLRQIEDSRLVKRPRTSYLIFLTERTSQGDFKHMAVKDIAVRVAEEWRGLTSSEKEVGERLWFLEKDPNTDLYRNTNTCSPSTKSVTCASTGKRMARSLEQESGTGAVFVCFLPD